MESPRSGIAGRVSSRRRGGSRPRCRRETPRPVTPQTIASGFRSRRHRKASPGSAASRIGHTTRRPLFVSSSSSPTRGFGAPTPKKPLLFAPTTSWPDTPGLITAFVYESVVGEPNAQVLNARRGATPSRSPPRYPSPRAAGRLPARTCSPRRRDQPRWKLTTTARPPRTPRRGLQAAAVLVTSRRSTQYAAKASVAARTCAKNMLEKGNRAVPRPRGRLRAPPYPVATRSAAAHEKQQREERKHGAEQGDLPERGARHEEKCLGPALPRSWISDVEARRSQSQIPRLGEQG